MAEQDSTSRLRRAAPGVTEIDRADFRLKVEPTIGMGKLQIFGAEADQRFAEVMGFAPPEAGRQFERGGIAVGWMAPGEWLLLGPEALIAGQLHRIADLAISDLLVVDLSHARNSFLLSGEGARTALAAHCPLDLWPGAFPVDAVARSMLGDAVMFIARLADTPDGPCFRVIVDQTVGAYAARMIAGPCHASGA